MTTTDEKLASVAAAFRTGAQSYGSFGAALYSALCAAGAQDREVIELAAHAQPGAQPVFHLLTAVHYHVLGNPDDPLARYFPTSGPGSAAASVKPGPISSASAWKGALR